MAAKPWWTVVAVYDDSDESFVHYTQAKDIDDAWRKALHAADGPIRKGGIFQGQIHPADEPDPGIVPIRGKGHAIEVHAVIVQRRQIVLPGRCPGCKSDTRRAHALRETNLRFQYWAAHLAHNGKDLSHERDHKHSEGNMIEAVGLRCGRCEHVIWDGFTDA